MSCFAQTDTKLRRAPTFTFSCSKFCSFPVEPQNPSLSSPPMLCKLRKDPYTQKNVPVRCTSGNMANPLFYKRYAALQQITQLGIHTFDLQTVCCSAANYIAWCSCVCPASFYKSRLKLGRCSKLHSLVFMRLSGIVL